MQRERNEQLHYKSIYMILAANHTSIITIWKRNIGSSAFESLARNSFLLSSKIFSSFFCVWFQWNTHLQFKHAKSAFVLWTLVILPNCQTIINMITFFSWGGLEKKTHFIDRKQIEKKTKTLMCSQIGIKISVLVFFSQRSLSVNSQNVRFVCEF